MIKKFILQISKYDSALASYKKAIGLGGTNGNAEKMIEKIEKLIGK